jgi:hypothetical protein
MKAIIYSFILRLGFIVILDILHLSDFEASKTILCVCFFFLVVLSASGNFVGVMPIICAYAAYK